MCVMAVRAENTPNGRESSRSDSIGCYEAYKELEEVSSVELLRSSILRSITKTQTTVKLPDRQVRPKSRSALGTDISDLSLSNVEIKFLERCSSIDSHSVPKSDSKQLQRQISLPVQKESDHQNISNPVLDVVNSKFWETPEDFPNPEEYLDRTPTIIKDVNENSKIKISSKNGLKLAFRTSSNTIFEDCSTYNINCNEVSLSKTNGCSVKEDNFTNSDSCSNPEINLNDRKQLLEDGFCIVGTQNSHKSVQYSDAADDQTPLCDTFFSTVINGDYVPISDNSVPKLRQKRLTTTEAERKEGVVTKEAEVREEDTVDGNNENTRIRRRIRKRNRKNKSNEPHVYECPKCGVSYTISTNMVNDAAYCLHCDLWTSVEPVFLKREKQPWNTCRIC